MPTFGDFKALARALRGQNDVTSVSLAQLSTKWVADDRYLEVRDEIDNALLRRLLCFENPPAVHRLVLYDLPERRDPDAPNRKHAEWLARLRRDVAYVGGADYQIRLFVLSRDGAAPREVAAFNDSAASDALARTDGTFPLTAGEAVTDWPYPDADPLFYLDLDVGDIERHQLARARHGRTAPRRRGRLARLIDPWPLSDPD